MDKQITVKLFKLINSTKALSDLASQPFRASVLWRLKKISNQVSEHLAQYDEVRLSLCKEFGQLDEASNTYLFKEESKQEMFDLQFAELINQEVEITESKLSQFDLGDAQLSLMDLSTLDWLIEIK